MSFLAGALTIVVFSVDHDLAGAAEHIHRRFRASWGFIEIS
jgi:hypothetical protein